MNNKTLLADYWYISNTINEYNSKVTGKYTTEQLALAKLPSCCDWYGHKGSGRIYHVEIFAYANGEVDVEETLVYQSDGINPIQKLRGNI